MNMKRFSVVTILAVALSFSVVAAKGQQQSYTPNLAVVMGLIQLSHFKLWLAGNLRNWPLAEYQLSQMTASLQEAKTLFPNVPKADTSSTMQTAEEFRDAIKAKNGARFD